MSTVAQEILAVIQAAGEIVTVCCPGCSAVVNLGEELAKKVVAETPAAEDAAVDVLEDAKFPKP